MNRRVLLVVIVVLSFTALVMPAQSVFAADFVVANASELITALGTANLNADADVIYLTGDIALTSIANSDGLYGNSGLPLIATPITIDGQGHTISRGSGSFRIFRVVVGGSLTLVNMTISNGAITSGPTCSTVFNTCGGGVFNEGSLALIHTRISGNTAVRGGGVYNNEGAVTVTDSTFFGNGVSGTSPQGGGLYNSTGGTVTITDSIFSGNTSGSLGGGMFNGNANIANVMISGSTFSNNTTSANGGGLYGSATITTSTFSGNTASFGGGMMALFQPLSISNSTFSENTAQNSGGGIYITGNGPEIATISGSTFSGNTAITPGGGIFTYNVSVSVHNSILKNSPGGGNCGVGGTGTINGDGFSLTDMGVSCTGFSVSSSINLGALTNNGGSTQTMALNLGSPAIDNGSPICGGNDQRGVTRGIDSVGGVNLPRAGDCDVGAFEAGGVMRTLQFASASNDYRATAASVVNVPVTLDAALTGASAVKAYVWISGGTAVAGVDYAPIGLQTVTINPGQTSVPVTINLLNPTTNSTIILSFATQNGPGFRGAVTLGARRTHTVNLTVSTATAYPDYEFYGTDTPTLSWNVVTNAVSYEIQVDTDTNFLAPYAFAASNIPIGQLSIQTNSLTNGIYYWRVGAKNAAGVVTWSPAQRFEVFE